MASLFEQNIQCVNREKENEEYSFSRAFSEYRNCSRTIANMGRQFFDVSSSDPSFGFEKMMEKTIVIPEGTRICHYYFSRFFSPILSMIKKRAHCPNDFDVLIFPSATQALQMALLFARKQYSSKIALVSPFYFGIPRICEALNLPYSVVEVFRSGNMIRLPVDSIISSGCKIVLITNPLYGTGEYYGREVAKELQVLRKSGLFCIVDEALSLPNGSLCKSLRNGENIISINSPHKSISINGFKFSLLLCPPTIRQIIQEDTELIAGGLNVACVQAVLHFLSGNFDSCRDQFSKYVENNRQHVVKLLDQFGYSSSAVNSKGHYVTVWFKTKFPGMSTFLPLYRNLLLHECVAFSPPWPNWENGFRINLTLDSKSLIPALQTILDRFDV